MALAQTCGSCGAEVPVHRIDAGKDVACTKCGAPCPVPANLDFLGADVAAARDVHSGGWLLTWLTVSMALCCVPVTAWVWWRTSGLIERAREEQRVVDPLLTTVRATSIVATCLLFLIYVAAFSSWILGGKL